MKPPETIVNQVARSAVPRIRWRVGALGSLTAVAIVLGLVVAPAAVAAPAGPAVPNLGSVRQLDVDLDAHGAAPLSLDLSDADIRFTSGTTTGTCRTQALGRCDVRWTSGTASGDGTPALRLPTGTYTVSQVAESAVPGLQPKPGTLATVTICDCWHTVLRIKVAERHDRLAVSNTSLYRHTITARVVDQATGDPVRDARYRLTGPGFRGLLADLPTLDAGVARSNRQGELSFSLLRASVLRPGTWTLTPVDVPAPYLAVPLSVELTADAPGGSTWAYGAVELALPVVPEPPSTGSATLTLQPSGPAPPGLDLSGVGFALVGTGAEPVTALCVTDAAGSCSIEVVPEGGSSDRQVEGTVIALPPGTYAVQQTTAPAGLTPAATIEPLELCVSSAPEACATTRVITNDSTYRTRTEVQVLSGNGPVQNTEVTLTGPGFAAGSVTTDDDGRGAWSGWFRPGEWWFAVAGRPEPVLVTMTPGQGDTSLPWRVEITLPSVEGAGTAEGNPGGSPTTPPAVPTQPPAPVVPVGVVAPSTLPSSTTVPVPGGGQQEAPAGPADGSGPGAGTGTPGSTTASSSPAPVNSDEGQVFVAAAGPELETESSSQLLTAGLVTGVGILFVALVLSGYAVLRNRTRRRV